MNILVSKSASVTKSMRGATAHIAKSAVKVGDDEHDSHIKKGEKFYLKKLGKSHYVMDVEKEKGKEVFYQFKVEKKVYDALMKKHPSAEDIPKKKGAKDIAKVKKPKAFKDPEFADLTDTQAKRKLTLTQVRLNKAYDKIVVADRMGKLSHRNVIDKLHSNPKMKKLVDGVEYLRSQLGLKADKRK